MRTWILFITLLLAPVAFAQPPAVANGADLGAWQVMEQRRLKGDDAVEAYRAFVAAYGASPLALVAWTRLVALDADQGDWRNDPLVRDALDRLERAWRAHQRVLDAHEGTGPVSST